MTRKTVCADDVKAAISDCFHRWSKLRTHPMEHDIAAAIDSLPAAEPDAGERVRRLTEAEEITAALYKPFHKAECECAICFDWHDWHQRVINGE